MSAGSASRLLSIWKSQLLFWPELGLELEFLSKESNRRIIPESFKLQSKLRSGKQPDSLILSRNILLDYGWAWTYIFIEKSLG